MKILILGGTRFLSRELARAAVARGHEVVCACRGSDALPPGVRFVELDREDPEAFGVLGAEEFDSVIDVARRPSFVDRAAVALVGRTGHFTLVSSTSVYADPSVAGQTPATGALLPRLAAGDDERSPASYGPNKVACEAIVRRAWGDDAFIVRAGLVVGPDDPTDRFTYWPVRLSRGGEVLVPGSPADPVQLIDVRDLAAWMLDGASDRRRGIFNAAGEVLSRERFLLDVARGSAPEAEVTFTWASQDALTAAGVQPWAGEKSLPVWVPEPDYAGFMAFDVSDALATGLRPRPLADTARDTLAWWATTGRSPDDLAAGLRDDDEAAVLAAVRSSTRP